MILSGVMNPNELDFPSPYDLKLEAEGMPPKVSLSQYFGALKAMKSKGYSYAEVAEWISGRLGVEVTRNKVAYLLTTPPEVLDEDDRADQAEAEADAAEGRK